MPALIESLAMDKADRLNKAIFQLAIYWAVVSLPLIWGIWKTLVKLPALFQ
jgi:hypothetical protein